MNVDVENFAILRSAGRIFGPHQRAQCFSLDAGPPTNSVEDALLRRRQSQTDRNDWLATGWTDHGDFSRMSEKPWSFGRLVRRDLGKFDLNQPSTAGAVAGNEIEVGKVEGVWADALGALHLAI